MNHDLCFINLNPEDAHYGHAGRRFYSLLSAYSIVLYDNQYVGFHSRVTFCQYLACYSRAVWRREAVNTYCYDSNII